MKKITLLCDGSSDLCLIDIINWIIDNNHSDEDIRVNAARELIPAHGRLGLRLKKTEDNHAPDVIVCHRDSEGIHPNIRLTEILEEAEFANITIPVVRAVPVRMIESWLLFDASAIRCAASNKNGKEKLPLPKINTLEQLTDPKEILFNNLKTASDLPPHRLSKFNPHEARHRITSFIEDFSPLRILPSFQRFENELLEALNPQIQQSSET